MERQTREGQRGTERDADGERVDKKTAWAEENTITRPPIRPFDR